MMTKCWKYVPIVLVVLFLTLGWKLIDKWTSGEEILTPLEVALQSAENNRKELEKVLRHYQQNPSDSLKYKAACFLIENMPFYSYSTSKQLENYKVYYACLKKSSSSPQAIADSIRDVFGPMEVLERKRDIKEVDSAYLCHNIDWAFKVWKEQPWGKNVPFDQFCEQILPYRIGDESLTYWREEYYKKYNSLLDSLRASDSLDMEDPVVVANYLMKKLPDIRYYYTTVTPFPFEHIGPKYVQYMSGTCREVTDFAIYIYRALGIPCSIDFAPILGYANVGHFWVVVKDKNGEEYLSDFPNALNSSSSNPWYDSAKIYRYTFRVNRELYEEMIAYGEELYSFWRLPKFIDVTRRYTHYNNKKLKIPSSKLYQEKRTGKIAYLCLSSKENWNPVDWTEYNRDNLVFRNIKKGAIMRVATYENGLLCFVTDPFYLDKTTNELNFYTPEGTDKEKVVLYAKCNISGEELFKTRMIGGVFEGSNHSDFADKDTLFIIQRKPNRLYTIAHSWSKKKYRYIRYSGPKYSKCNVAEIAFNAPGDTATLTGKVIGTPGCYQRDGSHEYFNVFDGKTETSFDYIESSGGWAGLDFGKVVQVDRIIYTPRNRDNYIRMGNTYELFYCDAIWKSAGKIRAVSDSLVFQDVPKNALLLLRNHTQGVDERIFIYEKETQVWK